MPSIRGCIQFSTCYWLFVLEYIFCRVSSVRKRLIVFYGNAPGLRTVCDDGSDENFKECIWALIVVDLMSFVRPKKVLFLTLILRLISKKYHCFYSVQLPNIQKYERVQLFDDGCLRCCQELDVFGEYKLVVLLCIPLSLHWKVEENKNWIFKITHIINIPLNSCNLYTTCSKLIRYVKLRPIEC